MNTKLSVIAAALVASAGIANAETDLSLARELSASASGYDALMAQDAMLDVGVQMHFRYQANFRDDDTLGDDDTTLGFVVRRAKVWVEGQITDNMEGKIQLAFDRGDGSAALEDAYVDWAINDDLTLRMGQFKQSLIREEMVSSKRQLAFDRSVANEAFNQDRSQGLEFRWGGEAWRFAAGFTDGLNTDNTAFNSANEADWALNARAEFLLGGNAAWSQFKQFTSWRGAEAGGMLGGAVAFQNDGDTNPSGTETEMFTATADYSWVADGWNAFGALIWQSTDDGTSDTDEIGAVVQAGVFVTDQDELYGRWSAIFPDSDNTNDEDFHAINVGWNHYLVPESHAAKITVDLGYYLDATDETDPLSTSDSINLLPSSEDGQLALTAQLQVVF